MLVRLSGAHKLELLLFLNLVHGLMVGLTQTLFVWAVWFYLVRS